MSQSDIPTDIGLCLRLFVRFHPIPAITLMSPSNLTTKPEPAMSMHTVAIVFFIIYGVFCAVNTRHLLPAGAAAKQRT